MKKREIILLFIGCILLFIGLYVVSKPYLREGMVDTGTVILTAVAQSGNIYFGDTDIPTGVNWKYITGKMHQISGSYGQLVGINNAPPYGTAFYSPVQVVIDNSGVVIDTSWVPLQGVQFKHLTFDWPSIYAIDKSDLIIYIDSITFNTLNTQWTVSPGQGDVKFSYISVKQGRGFAIGTDSNIYYIYDMRNITTNNVMGNIAGKKIVQLSYDGSMLAAVDSSNKLYVASRNLETSPNWLEVKGPISQISIQSGMAACVAPNGVMAFSANIMQADPGWIVMNTPEAMRQVELYLPLGPSQRITRFPIGGKCMKGEDLVQGKCISACPTGMYPNGSVCLPVKRVIDTPSSIACIRTPYGSIQKWLCDTRNDALSLVKDPSAITSYIKPTDLVCTADDPTTAMYFCESVADVIQSSNTSIGLSKNYSVTCNNLKKNYTDLSNNLTNLTVIKNSIDDGSATLGTATTALNAVYAQLKCSTTPATNDIKILCAQLQQGIKTISGDSSSVNSLSTNFSGIFTIISKAQKDLQASINGMC
jgi:hypothetical protein